MPIYRVNNTTYNIPDDMSVKFEQRFPNAKIDMYNGEEKYSIPVNEKNNFVKAYPKATFEYQGNDISSQEQPSNPVQDFQPSQEVKDYALNNIPDMFKSKGNNLSTHPLQAQEDFSGGTSDSMKHRIEQAKRATNDQNMRQFAIEQVFKPKGEKLSTRPLQTQEDFFGETLDFMNRIATDENRRIEQAERAANDPYMRQQEIEHVFKPKNQEQINTVRNLIEEQNKRLDKRLSIHSGSGNNAFNALANSTRYNRETSDDRNQKAVLGYAEKLIEQAQNITDEAKRKGNTNFLAGFYRGFRDTPLDVWAMGLANLRDYAVANQVMDKVDKGEKLNPAEDALMQALVTNAATQMYYAGDLGRGYKAGGAIHESLPFMLDMLLGMGTIQAVTKPAAKSLLKYATEKAVKYGLGKATTGLAKGAARTISGLRDVAAHTATFGSQRVAADYLRRGLGDIQVKPNEDGTVSYDGRENIQTGGEAIGKAIVSTAAETGSELLGEYFAPMLGWIGRATGANRIGKIIPASVGKAYSSLVDSQGFKQVQEIARRAKIADPIGEYGEEVVNNLVSTAIGDMTPEQLVDLDQNIDTFLGVAPMSALFGAAGTAGYLRGQYRNYRNMRQFENRMQEEMGEDWSGVREALQDADIETAREMVKDVLSSGMTPQLKKDAITYISSVLQEQTLQNADKQSMPEDIAQAKRDILTNLSNTRRQIPLSDEQLGVVMSRVESQDPSALDEMGFTPEQQDMIMSYNDAYQDYNNYTFWVQDTARNARRQAEQQVESLTNATTVTVMRVKAGFSQEPVNILRGNVMFDAEGKVDREKSDNVVYYLDKDGKVQMSSIDAIENVIDDSPAEEVAAQAGTDAENEVLQSEEAQVNPPIELGTVFRNNGQNLIVARKTPQGYEIAAVDENGELIPEVGTQEVSEEDLRNAMSTGQSQPEETSSSGGVQEQPASTETQAESPVHGESSETSQEQEPQTALSRIPTNDKGEHNFEAAPAEDTGAALMEISEGDIDDAKDTADQMILSYQEQLKKADKMKTTGASIQEIVKLKQDKKTTIRQINDKIHYWQSVSDAIEKKRPGGIIAEAKKVSDENQQRLASMTPQEQSEAQAKVQENINKGVYNRQSQKRTKTRYVKEDNELGQANTPMEHVLREIATGRVTFLWNDNGPTQGLGRHLGYSESSAERKKLIWAFSNETGMTPEAASEAIHADMPENLQGMVTDQDIFNMIVQAFQEYGTPSKMWKAAKEMHGTDDIESMPGYQQDIERQALEWEASENNMTVQEWIAYCDFIEEELDNMFSSVSDKELNTIFEQINDDYERRNETESAGSTQGQADSKQSDEILPASESDNTGAGEESREQPERTAETDGEGGSVVPEQKPAEEDELKNEKEISGRIQETENEWEEEGEYGTKYFRTILVDGTRNVTQVDEPDEKGNYTGSYFLYDNNRFPGIPEIIDYIDSPSSDTKIEKARSEVDQNPTEAQKEAGNYRKGHVKIDGFNVTIENPKGSVRSGKDADGNEWSVTMNNDYGYIRGTEGVDGDHIDVFLSDNPDAGDVFVIDQVNADDTFDEHKVMYGFKSALAAKRAYLANYSAGWKGLGNITRVTKEEFRKWIDSSNRKTKPFAEYKSVNRNGNNEVLYNPEVQNHNWEQYKKGDVLEYEGYPMRFSNVEKEPDGTVTGVVIEHLDKNGNVTGRESVPPLMFIQNYKKSNDLNLNTTNSEPDTHNIGTEQDRNDYVQSKTISAPEINDSPFEQIIKDGAIAYINGNVNFATSIAYQQIYNYVRNRPENNQSDSTTENSAQPASFVDEATGRESRPDGVQTVGMAGGNDNSGSGQNSKELNLFPDGERSDTGIRREESGNDGLSAGDTGRKGSGRTGSNGHNVRKRGGERVSKSAVKSNPKRGGKSTDTERNGIINEINSLLDEFVKAGNESASISVIGMNSRQIEIAGKILVAGVRLGYTYIKDGITKFTEWRSAMREKLAIPFSSSMNLTDSEIDEFISDMWEYPHTVDGETRPLKEWASIMDKKQLMDSVKSTLNDKKKLQEEAESVPVKIADRSNISETLPFLLPQQQDDVFKAEIQFFDESHNDRDHAFGKGYMFTNGTGTGKTYTGLGIVKRFIKQGKGRILILTPSQTKVSDWIKDAANLGIELNDLDAVSKTKKDGTTATTEKGEGAVITTYANFRQNKALLEDLFDLVVYDESHRLLENKGGTGTTGSIQHYKISNRNEQFAFLRLQEINSVWNELQSKYEKFNSERDDVIERIKKENGIKNELTLGQRVELPPIFNGNWTENAERKFPKLSKLRKEISLLNAKFENETKPELERKAKENVKHTKVVFLSATPFNTRENLDYAEGYIFSYPEREKQDGYSIQSPRSQFYLEHFGAGYRWRYHRLENSGINPEAVSKQEVEFSDYLQHTLQTMSGRIIDSPFDYSRDFPTVTLDKAEEFNSAMEELSRDETTRSAYYEVMGDYNYTSALFESMKVAQIIPRLKEHLAHGRKAVIFHRRVESKNPILPPFKAIFDRSVKALETEYDAAKKDKKKRKIAALRSKYAGMLEWERKLDLRMPREQLADAFGKGNVLFFSGKESKGMKDKAVNDFNNDESGKSIIVIQEASGKEGISLHDTTGKHQRVLVTLALPQSPITALQIEGRIYRIGNKSNAIFEYPLLGLNAELMLFGQKFNQQVSTTENLALGSQARNLRESFARGVEEHSGDVDIDGQGIGGKEYDASNPIETDAFGSAVLDYYTNMKLTGRRDNREGIDYYPTPEPLGFMMSRWGRISEGESVLEPSAGHGAIARYVPRENQLTAIEPSQRLFSKLQIKAGGNGRTFENTIFEAYNIVNKHDVVLMNPPFGTGGKLAVDHVAKAFQHLDEGGRIVTIIPRGTADKKFDKWYMEQKNAVMSAEINLPDITFERAGTSVNCRVVVIDKVTNETLRNDASSRAEHIDLSGKRYDKIEEFFEDIRNIDVPERTIDTKAKLKRKSATTARELKAMKDIKYVSLDENRIYVSGNGVSAEIEWGDRKDDVLTSYLSYQYRRFKGNYDYAAQHGRETQEAAYGEMKNLACKLAGMTEDEMQRYIDKNNENVRYREEDSVQRSIVDREINELAKEYLNEDLTRYPYEDRRTDKNKEGEVYYGYSEPLFKGENLMDSEFVPEVIKDIVRNDEYEIDPKDITDTLQKYIESEGGPEEEFARPFVDAFEWFNENRKDIRMSDKVNLIIDRNDSRMRDGSGMENISADSTEDIKREVEKTAYKLNVPVEVITSTDQIKDESVRKAIESGRKIKGWYSLSDRKVYVYLPNTSSVEDAKQTILHEGVAHFGLRKLVGDENMDSFLDDIFANVTKEVREEIISTLPRYGWDSRVATEEYLGSMAEQGADVSVWQRIIQAFKNLLRKIGIRMEINDKELRYILWRSRQNLESGNVLDMAKDIAMQYEMGVGNYYREESPSDGSREKYEESLKGWRYKATEAYQDSMLSLKNLQDIIAEVSGKPIKSFENAYMAENQLSSKNTAEAEKYYKNDFVPMLEAAGKMMKKYGLTQKAIERYMMLAHGIERNVEMSIREQANEIMKDNPDDAQQFVDDFRAQRDSLRQKYSGYEYLKELSGLAEGIGDFSATQAILESMDGNEHADFQNDALEHVRQFEDMYDVKELWEKTNKATKDTLRKTYESGMMGKDLFADVSKMFMYYVPLRGWSEETAEDVYEYINSERNPVNSVLRSMKGRKSIPDEVFATIGNMAESAILQGNRNMMKQNFMSMVMNHPTDLATMRRTWYVYDNNTGEWHISTPEIEEKDTAAIIEKKISDHEERMKQLEEKGLATQTSSGLNIDYRIQPRSAKEHIVQVKNGGKDYTIYVNANPRAAQAINGMTNPDVEKNPIFKAISTANRWLAANFTTRNPAFVFSNLSRDLIFSMSAVYIKEDGKYSSRYRKNLLKTPSAVLRNIRGKGNPNTNEIDRYFQEFIENGGETGYMHLNDVDKYKKKVRAELAKIDGSRGSAKAALDYTLERLEDFNRWAEDISRFTVYMTSRQMGRTVQESVNDAKEITVNFNKKGAGYKTSGFFGLTAGMMRNLYLFFNASVQSLTNFKRLAVRNRTKFFSILGGFSAAGMLMPVINAFLYNLWDGGDDDPYNDLPEWVRRNNLCIYAGNGKFVTIPLPIELRAFYGIGDMAYRFATGKEKATPTNVVKSTVNQLAELLPLNPTGNEGLKTFMPDALAPIFEAYVWNEDFTGKPVAKITPFNERDPEWKRVYKGTSGWLVDTSKFLNDLSNGSGPGKEFRKGFLDFNPAKVEHLLESYFGGMAKTLNQAGKTIYYGSKSIIEGKADEDLTMRNVPILNRFINKVDDRNAFSGINRDYFNLKDEMEQFKYELNGVKKNYRKNPEEYKEMVSSDDFRKYVKYRPYEKRLSRLSRIAKETEGEERDRIEEMIIETRREAINAVK